MKVIYIAGKYRSDTEWGLTDNIRHAELAARRLWGEGWAVICPHKNSAHFGGLKENPEDDQKLWMEGDLEILSRCDAIYMLSNYKESNGALLELAKAWNLGLEIYYE